ncbi:MAG: M48 family metallopeptidase [Caulobacteraceae bacterium]|nr:M48 family metallopeptidase [Caulobacteraceae bacterium]
MGAVGLKTWIWQNNFRSLLLLAGFPFLLIGLIWALQLGLIAMDMAPTTGSFTGDLGLSTSWLAATAPLGFVLAGGWYGVAFFGHQGIIDMATGAKKVERKDAPDLYNLLENLCISRGQTMPQLRVVETEQRNAWASGLGDKDAVITVTRGLLNTLNRDELEAVLAHELTHVINRDVRLTVIAAVFAGVITLICEIFFRMLRFGGGRGSSRSRSGGGGGGAGALILIAIAAAAIAYILALVVRSTISKKREFIADAGAVELTKNPDAMISALQKISGHSEIQAPRDIQSMFIDFDGGGMFASHPPIGKRIEALVKYGAGTNFMGAEAARAVATSVPPSGA